MSELIEELEEIDVLEEAVEPLVVGSYALFDELAAGGMASVYLGRLLAPDGLGQTVAIKRMHQRYTSDPEFCAMFLDEARFVGRLVHQNLVRTIDVVRSTKGLFLVMEYIHGESLSRIMRLALDAGTKVPPQIAGTVLHGALLGLHSAHELAGDDGMLLGVVHRDVSPQNIIVGLDGIPRVLDFGVAKAAGRMQITRDGQLKGKLAYMAPEQISGRVDRRADVFAAGVVLWEAIAGRRLHECAKDAGETVQRIVAGTYPNPSELTPDCPPALDRIVLQALAADPMKRFSTAQHMADAIRDEVGLVSRAEVAAYVKIHASEILEMRAEHIRAMERAAADLAAAPLVEGTSVPPAPASTNRRAQRSSRPSLPDDRKAIAPRRTRVALSTAAAVLLLTLGGYNLYSKGFADGRRSQASADVPLDAPASAVPEEPAPSLPAPPQPVIAEPTDAGGTPLASGAANKLRAAPASASPISCNPPWVEDNEGFKHYKPACMGL